MKPYDGFSASGVFQGKMWGGETKNGANNNAAQTPYGLQMNFGGNQPHENRPASKSAFIYKRSA